MLNIVIIKAILLENSGSHGNLRCGDCDAPASRPLSLSFSVGTEIRGNMEHTRTNICCLQGGGGGGEETAGFLSPLVVSIQSNLNNKQYTLLIGLSGACTCKVPRPYS